jgi:membrane protein
MTGQQVWTLLQEPVHEFVADDVLSPAAVSAFYTALGLAPTTLLFLAVTTFRGEGTKQALLGQVEVLVGGSGAGGIAQGVRSAQAQHTTGTRAALVGIGTVLLSASGILAQLQTALNRIWNVTPTPRAGYWSWIRSRLLSLGLLLAVLFLLLVSLAVSTAIALLLPTTGTLRQLGNLAVSLAVFVLLFALAFKFLPDVQIAWREVWVGAVLTAVLLAVGKHFIGLYLGHRNVASSYGAAGSLGGGARISDTQTSTRRTGQRRRVVGAADFRLSPREIAAIDACFTKAAAGSLRATTRPER